MRNVRKSLTSLSCFATLLVGSVSSRIVTGSNPVTMVGANLQEQGGRRSRQRIEKGYIPVDDRVQLFYRKVNDCGDVVVVPLGFYLYMAFMQHARDRTVIFYDMRNRGRSSAMSNGEKITSMMTWKTWRRSGNTSGWRR